MSNTIRVTKKNYLKLTSKEKEIFAKAAKLAFSKVESNVQKSIMDILPPNKTKKFKDIYSNSSEITKVINVYFYEWFEFYCNKLGYSLKIEDGVGYDAVIRNGKVKIEFKLSADTMKSSFATGNKFSNVKVNEILCFRYEIDKNSDDLKFDNIWVGLVNTDIIKETSSDGGWIFSKKNNNAFSKLKVPKESISSIDTIIGDVKLNNTWVGLVYESLK